MPHASGTNFAVPAICLLLIGVGPPLSDFRRQSLEGTQKDVDAAALNALRYRLVGPFRGGRATTVAGVRGAPTTYYFGTAGGGVWKTSDAGATWAPIFDAQPVGAIGAVAVAPSDSRRIYVGTGDADLRNNVSHGMGVFRSDDAGATWRRIGLEDTRHIAHVVVHPTNADVVLVTAIGHAFGPNRQRGVFRTEDGGHTWAHVLFVNEDTGAFDVTIDRTNPSRLFATTWQVRRSPHGFVSGGPGSALWRSEDGGRQWTKVEGGGWPGGLLGKIGVAISPADPKVVFAIAEAEDSARGFYRSSDGGRTWTLVNRGRAITQRAWFFMDVIPDPRRPDVVYVMNINLLRSTDGGRSFNVLAQHHVDNQALWIDPDDPERLINGNDGGANISVNGGRTWSRSDQSQPTGQFYHVAADTRAPYWIYGGQQDFNTIAIASRSDAPGITERDWHGLVNCEMGFAVPDPQDANIVYGGCTDGGISMYDHRTRRTRSIETRPEPYLGHAAADQPYRFQWTAPILVSVHDPRKLYHAANVLFRSLDRGERWTVVSPDLTRNDRSRQQASGGPLTRDNVGGEVYSTIFALTESPKQADLLWVGSDDGLVHVTRDGGANWERVTPAHLPEWSRVSIIDASPHDARRAWLAVDRHLLDDYAAYVYRTDDMGHTWRRVNDGIPEGAFVRAVREDVREPQLVFAGTELGVYVSLTGGATWQSLQLNLPVSPVHDLIVKDNDLIVATHGRAFWILDDLSPLRALAAAGGRAPTEPTLLSPSPAMRVRSEFGGLTVPAGENPPLGAVVDYWLPSAPRAPLVFSIHDANGRQVRRFATDDGARSRGRWEQSSPLTARAGLNRFVWDLRFPAPELIPEQVVFWHPPLAPPVGALTAPGAYQVQLTVDGRTLTAPLVVTNDPRVSADRAALEAQLRLHARLVDGLSMLSRGVGRTREWLKVVSALEAAAGAEGASRTALAEVRDLLRDIESALTEPRMTAGADAFYYPLRLDHKLMALIGVVANADDEPTASAYELHIDLWQRIGGELDKLAGIERRLREYEEIARRSGIAWPPAAAPVQLPPVLRPL